MMNEEDAAYLKGRKAPIAGSILTSTSRFLNNPRMRDVYAQMGLKRDGLDLPPAYLIPELDRAIAEEFDQEHIEALLAAEKARLPELARWLDACFVSNWKDRDLTHCATGTVGAEIRTFLSETPFDVDFMFRDAPGSDLAYLQKRRVQNHDIEHLLTGFDPSQVGEIALIVANAVAIHAYFEPELAGALTFQPMTLVSTSIMRMTCHYPDVVPAILEGVARGQAMGARQERPLFMIRWEDWVDVPLDEARRSLHIDGGPEDGHWAWVDSASRG